MGDKVSSKTKICINYKTADHNKHTHLNWSIDELHDFGRQKVDLPKVPLR